GFHAAVRGACALRPAMRTVVRTFLIAACIAAGLTGLDRARADYPERQITMIVSFPAGGGTDIVARLINTQLGEALGKPVIIENRGGAGGNIGIAAGPPAGRRRPHPQCRPRAPPLHATP